MSTSARIGILNNDGTVTSIYCHRDDYYRYVGNLLKKHYAYVDKIKCLINLGDLSSLGKEPKSDPSAWKYKPFDFKAPSIKTIEDLWGDLCVAYKDRPGEDLEDCKAFTFASIEDYLKSDCEYLYLYNFTEGFWKCCEPRSNKFKKY